MNNGYNYRTLNPWEQTALEHLSAMIGEIIGAGFEDPSCLMERVSNMVLELSYWDTPDKSVSDLTDNDDNCNCDEEIAEILGISGEDGDKKINPDWDDEKTQTPGSVDVDYETAYIYANRPDPIENENGIDY